MSFLRENKKSKFMTIDHIILETFNNKSQNIHSRENHEAHVLCVRSFIKRDAEGKLNFSQLVNTSKGSYMEN